MPPQTPFRVVSWNVCGGFRRKLPALAALAPDLAVLQEVRTECLQATGLESRSVWRGREKGKGLAVVGFGDWRVARADFDLDERWFLPARVSLGDLTLNVVAVWVDTSKGDCTPPTLRALQGLHDFVASGPTILAGDFNQSVSWDVNRKPGRQFRDVLNVFDEWDLASAWHACTGEAHGAETLPTHYWMWKEARPFHIDYVFASRRLTPRSATLGGFGAYVAARLSDHVPLSVELALSAG